MSHFRQACDKATELSPKPMIDNQFMSGDFVGKHESSYEIGQFTSWVILLAKIDHVLYFSADIDLMNF